MSKGSLRVTVIEGRNLRDKDKFGQNDAYIEVYLDKNYKQRTTTIKNNNSPTWNETFTFNLMKGQDDLCIKVYDDDVIGKDSIGGTKISLKKVEQAGGRLEDWFKLPGRLGLGTNGEVRLRIEFN